MCIAHIGLTEERISDVGIGENTTILVAVSLEEASIIKMLHREWGIQDSITNGLGGMRGLIERDWGVLMDNGYKVGSRVGTFQTDEFGSEEVEATLTEVTVSIARLR